MMSNVLKLNNFKSEQLIVAPRAQSLQYKEEARVAYFAKICPPPNCVELQYTLDLLFDMSKQ